MRVRFAPSPTGHLHIGGARTAIFNWLFARHNNGVFLVRVEDTDVERSKQEYVDSILESLKWLHLTPDEPLTFQLSRIEEHKQLINQLLEKGLVYPCFCEPKDVEDRLKDFKKGIAEKYDGTCRDKSYTPKDLKKPHAIRFKLPEREKISFKDLIRGTVTFDIDQLDDFVILRRDGVPTYNFCVVVDDIFMKISHVIRGEDHISNTPKQLLIYDALGAEPPIFAHLPLILGSSGGKLSKRDAAVSVVEYKNQGFLPEALFNYLVRLGWAHGDQEVFSKQEMIDFFSLDKVGKKGAIFDTKKLLWLNGIYIRNLKFNEFAKAAAEAINDKLKKLTAVWKEDMLGQLFELYKERATTMCELVDNMISFAHAPEHLDVGLIKKWVSPQTKTLLFEFVKGMDEMEEHTHENLIALARHICELSGVKLVALAQPLRLALTGSTHSPGVFELMEVLGCEESKKRVKQLVGGL
ncbi:glutamate--tRNA ligase [Candidatus Dependentiae bacterium]|nr:glutamate--tRNA ligase [Candidatus Dependentiae bacterium]